MLALFITMRILYTTRAMHANASTLCSNVKDIESLLKTQWWIRVTMGKDFTWAGFQWIRWNVSYLLVSYGVPEVKYVTLISDKLPEILCDTLKKEFANFILFSWRLLIKCLTHMLPCQTPKLTVVCTLLHWRCFYILLVLTVKSYWKRPEFMVCFTRSSPNMPQI